MLTNLRKTPSLPAQQHVTISHASVGAPVAWRASLARVLPAAALALFLGCGGGSSTDITPPPPADTTAPTVTATTPTNNAVDVALNATASITFSEPINSAILTTTSVTVVSSAGGAGATIAGAVTFTGTAGTFTPTTPLAGSTRYTVTVTTAVKE